IAQGWVGSSAMAGVARNPGSKSAVQTLMILTLVLIESLVIYALVVSLLLYAKL
ncbi:ATP synthase F0 subunit C, partial [Myxococcota bacterium]|nr:ATP synthase F0 subunit C [Myxococcota bacterium]